MTAPVSVVRSTPTSSGLYDVLDLILDKGLVIDAYVRVSVVGIELLTIDLRVVIASVDTYLRFAEAVDRLTLHEQNGKGLDDLMDGGGDDDEDDEDDEKKSSKRSGGRRAVGSGDDSSVKGAVKKVRDRVSGEDDEDEPGVVQKVRKAVTGNEKKSRNSANRRKSS